MSDRDAFLRAIVADAEDDAPRLVFADWLDEHGDPDRAEFIRLQCRMAASAVPDTDDRLRAADLLDAHRHEWVAEFPADLAGVRAVHFKRGFVGEADFYHLDALRHYLPALRHTTARAARVTGYIGAFPEDWPEWDLTGLSGLSFACWRCDAAIRSLLASRHVAGLRSLKVAERIRSNGVLALLADSPIVAGLRRLAVFTLGIRGSDTRALADSPNLACLHTLDLQTLDATPAALCILADSRQLTSLRSLKFSGTVAGPTGIGLSASPVLAGLERLDLTGVVISTDDAASLFASDPPAGLRSLGLDVSNEVAQVFARSAWVRGLTELRFSGDGDPLLALAGAGPPPELRELSVQDSADCAVGLRALAAVGMPRLASLHVTGAGDAMRAVAWGDGFPALRRLEYAPSRGNPSCLPPGLPHSPLASRLTALDLEWGSGSRPDDVVPLLDRAAWPCLVRLGLRGARLEDPDIRRLADRWGPVLRFDPPTED